MYGVTASLVRDLLDTRVLARKTGHPVRKEFIIPHVRHMCRIILLNMDSWICTSNHVGARLLTLAIDDAANFCPSFIGPFVR